jgi:hypothetical protein
MNQLPSPICELSLQKILTSMVTMIVYPALHSKQAQAQGVADSEYPRNYAFDGKPPDLGGELAEERGTAASGFLH